MPQAVDLEALVCGGGDGKIVCETTLHDPAGGAKQGELPLPSPPPDEPAESFRLPVEAEIDWVDRNAAALYDRDDSTKEITNPKSHQHHSNNPNPNVKLHSSSQHYAAKPKAPIIGLPNKLQHSGYLGRSSRRHASSVRIFPKKGAPQRGKSAVPESEPTSPKVSCVGRVLSDRDRNRRRKAAHDKGPSDVSRAPSSIAASSHGRGQRTGFWASIFGFSCCVQGTPSAFIDEEGFPSSRATTSTTKHKTTSIVSRADAGDDAAPGVGGMKRFASGRRPASWGGDFEQDAEPVSKSGPLTAKQQGAGILGRRSAGALADLDLDRDWESSGPASV